MMRHKQPIMPSRQNTSSLLYCYSCFHTLTTSAETENLPQIHCLMINEDKCWFSWWIQSLSYLKKVNVHLFPFIVVTGKAYVRSHDYIWQQPQNANLFFKLCLFAFMMCTEELTEAKRKRKRSELLNWNPIHKSVWNQQPATDSSLWNVQRLTSSTLWWVDSRFVRFSGRSCKYKCIMGTNNNIYDKQSRCIKVYVDKGPPVST